MTRQRLRGLGMKEKDCFNKACYLNSSGAISAYRI